MLEQYGRVGLSMLLTGVRQRCKLSLSILVVLMASKDVEGPCEMCVQILHHDTSLFVTFQRLQGVLHFVHGRDSQRPPAHPRLGQLITSINCHIDMGTDVLPNAERHKGTSWSCRPRQGSADDANAGLVGWWIRIPAVSCVRTG